MSGPIVLTSSRDSSVRLRQFLNELELAIPNAIKVNRGRQSIVDIAGKALSMGATKIVYFGSRGGNPGFIRFLRVREGLVEVLPYLIRIRSVKLLLDMQVRVVSPRKSRSAVLVSLGVSPEVAHVLSEQLEIPSLLVQDFESIRGMYDTVFLIHRVAGDYEVQILNGRDLGPYGPFMRISDVIYVRSRVIKVE